MMEEKNFISRKGKDSSPKDTLRKIKECLSGAGMSASAHCLREDVEDCFSCRVSLDGPLSEYIGANGKGTTEDYCMVSGYAELMERIQNQVFTYQPQPFDTECFLSEDDMEKESFCHYVPLEELQADEHSFLHRMIQRYARTIKNVGEELDREQLVWAQFIRLFPWWRTAGVLMVPFYHVQSHAYQWLPVDVIRNVSASNGMAAGNTLEEALVQGYSEIFERYAQCRILEEDLTPPDIPAEVLEQYPFIMKIIRNIESAGPFHVVIKDCSLGMGFPVVCGIIYNRKQQTFGVKFGAHPNMQIALERIFTEAMQGKRLEEFAAFNVLSFRPGSVHAQRNMFNLMKTGGGVYFPSLLCKTPDWEWKPWDEPADVTNQKLAKQMTDLIIKNGCELYIADMSHLGFPTVSIYVENMSEIIPVNYTVLKAYAIKYEAATFLQDIPLMNREKAERLLGSGELLRYSVLENTIPTMCRMPISASFHGGNDQISFMMAVCHYYLGNYQEAAGELKKCMALNDKGTKEYTYENLLLLFFRGKAGGMQDAALEDLLYQLGEEEVVKQILHDFENPQTVFAKLYPSCDGLHCGACTNLGCHYEDMKRLYRTLFEKMYFSKAWTKELHEMFGGRKDEG